MSVRDWVKSMGVRTHRELADLKGLKLVAGVNCYKGQYQVFVAKVSDKGYVRSMMALPPELWPKVIEAVQELMEKAKEIERRDLIAKYAAELRKLKEMGVSLEEIVKAAEGR